jgi:hypothetical protein
MIRLRVRSRYLDRHVFSSNFEEGLEDKGEMVLEKGMLTLVKVTINTAQIRTHIKRRRHTIRMEGGRRARDMDKAITRSLQVCKA